MKQIKLIALSVVLFGLFGTKSVTGQTYYFSQSTEIYNELQNATLIYNNFNSGQFWNGNYGFSIDYFKRSYNFNGTDGLLISSDGYVASAEYNDSTDITVNSSLAHLETRTNNSGLYAKVEGQSGNRIVKLEWRNMRFSNLALRGPKHYRNEVWSKLCK